DLVKVASLVKPPIDGDFEYYGEERREQRGDDDGQQKWAAPPVDEHDQCIAAHHGCGAMRQVEKSNDPQRDRQAHRHEEEQHAIGKPVKDDAGEIRDHRTSATYCATGLPSSPIRLAVSMTTLS